MKSNIISVNTVITNKFESEKNEAREKLKVVNSILERKLEFSDRVIAELKKKQAFFQNIINSKKKFIYIARSELLLQEYKSILNQPMSPQNQTQLQQRKKEIVLKYINVVKSLVAEKCWLDVDINIPIHNIDVKKPLCVVCGNDDSYKFEINDYNNKICIECSAQQTILETGITYRDYNRVNIVGKFVYNRVLHFQDCIKQYQGKQNCKIPDKLYEDLDKKFKAYRLLVDSPVNSVKYSKITKEHITLFLKELRYTKHYENVNMIYHTLTDKQIDNIDYLEPKLVEDFKQLVNLYDSLHGKDKPDELDRKNFMNVQYVLFQLLRRHTHPCKIDDFAILKTVDRKLFHDEICRNLFEKLGWNFTPTF
jgi:hypothetical protein